MSTMVRFHQIGGPETLRLDEVDPPSPAAARSRSAPAPSA
jgi:hypothetical protein